MNGVTATTRAILLDSLGTLVELEPPWIHLREALGDGVPADELERAVRAEMRYYRAHSDEGRDPDSLADLRRRCAAVLSGELGIEVEPETLMAAIRLRAYRDAGPALEELRAAGLALHCVSNWDCSLPDVLERCGLASALDGVVTSAQARARKPDPAIFAAALGAAGSAPEEAIHVGDTPDEDLAGARAAGVPALLIDRDGTSRAGASGGSRIASLHEIKHYLHP